MNESRLFLELLELSYLRNGAAKSVPLPSLGDAINDHESNQEVESPVACLFVIVWRSNKQAQPEEPEASCSNIAIDDLVVLKVVRTLDIVEQRGGVHENKRSDQEYVLKLPVRLPDLHELLACMQVVALVDLVVFVNGYVLSLDFRQVHVITVTDYFFAIFIFVKRFVLIFFLEGLAVPVHGMRDKEAHQDRGDQLKVHEERYLPVNTENDSNQSCQKVEVSGDEVHELPLVDSLIDKILD